MNASQFTHGAHIQDNQATFRVWAPKCEQVDLILESYEGNSLRECSMEKRENGFFECKLDASAGDFYRFRLHKNNNLLIRPDPASCSQPKGVHQASELIDQSFDWTDQNWKGINIKDYLAYELHVGTFGENSNFEDIINHLDYFIDLGINAIELMPISQFPGTRNWGYDGVYPFAVQNSYGGVNGLKKLVNACHNKSIAVILDVVYNHMGPEGNYLHDFGPYFTDHYHTPWGMAVNFDDAYCGPVRDFFTENALYWVSQFHIDALRLDAIHAIHDESAYSILEQISDAVHEYARQTGRNIHVIAESDLNDPKIVHPKAIGGYGLDAQWSDDFHHSVHTLLTGENQGYYSDFGSLENLKKCLDTGFVYTGDYSTHRKRTHGRQLQKLTGQELWIYSQNHDQVGNRMLGERLHQLVSSEKHLIAAGLTLLSPYTPMLFMGEEYAEKASFQYFISHGDKDLIEAVRKGRQKEFESFNWHASPDPQSIEIFNQCKLDHSLKEHGIHKTIYQNYKMLIAIRKQFSDMNLLNKENMTTEIMENSIFKLSYKSSKHELDILFNFNEKKAETLINYPDWDVLYWSVPTKNLNLRHQSLILEQDSFIVLHLQKV